jgi:hypothetical protein
VGHEAVGTALVNGTADGGLCGRSGDDYDGDNRGVMVVPLEDDHHSQSDDHHPKSNHDHSQSDDHHSAAHHLIEYIYYGRTYQYEPLGNIYHPLNHIVVYD